MRKNNEILVLTPSVLGTSLPPNVKLWYEVHKISQFFDKPRQCNKCYKFSHSTRMCCSKHQVCILCAQVHAGTYASAELLCINCHGKHAANEKTCPTYQREVKLQKFQGQNHLTIWDARQQFKESNNTQEKSFAKVATTTIIGSISKIRIWNSYSKYVSSV